MYKDTITIYNRRFDPDSRSFHYSKNIIDGVIFQGTHAVTSVKGGIVGANSFKVFIPAGAKSRDGMPYLSPDEFNSSAGSAFTLQVEDIIVKGACPYEIPPKSENDVLSDFYDSFQILSVSDLSFGSRRTKHLVASGGDWRGR